MKHPFTPTYIAMAKAAEEIQAMRDHVARVQVGDWFIQPYYDDEPRPLVEGGSFMDWVSWVVVKYENGRNVVYDFRMFEGREDEVWLPRLDQLLGMLGSSGEFPRILRGASYEEVIDDATGEYLEWHQLALVLVMKEKYGKAWREGVWQKA